jgi:hypothetical protein
MSGWFGFSQCDIKQVEEEKRKTLLHQTAIKVIEERRASMLAKNADARIYVNQNDREVEFVAWDKTGNIELTREVYHF